MAGGRLIIPGWARALDSDGAPVAAAVSLFDEGTADLASVYSDEALTVPLTNPILSNAAGRFPAIWADDSSAYDWSVVAPYGPPGSPFTGTGLTTANTADLLILEAMEAAADQAAIDAAIAAEALADILALAAAAPDTDPVVIANKADLDGSNITGANQAAFRNSIGAVSSAALVAADGSGGDLIATKALSGPSVLRTWRNRYGDEISLWDVDGIYQYKAAIQAGTHNASLSTAINAALAAYKRVIVRAGVYPTGAAILLGMSEQVLEFEEGAWFAPLSSANNGIACPHGILDAKLINPGLIGRATTQVEHTGIFWNTNALGTAPFGSTTSDDMGGVVEDARFKGQTPGTNGWNNFVHSNMVDGFTLRNAKGEGLYGTATNNGYGIVASGTNTRIVDCDFDGLITGQGRHAVYLGDQAAGSIVSGLRARRFRKSAIAVNTSVTSFNQNIEIVDFILRDVALDVDASASNGAVELSYQGGATAGGKGISISNGLIDNSGTMGIFARGYSRVQINGVQINDWGATAGGSYSALRLEKCDDAQAIGLQSFTAAANNGGNTISHIFLKESSRVKIRGGEAVNTGSGAQFAAVNLDATGIGTPDALIDRFSAVKGTGSWSNAPYVNPTQNGSTVVYPKFGGSKVDTQTGVDITLDVTGGESVVVMNSGATSVLQLLPAGVGQVVTLRMTGATQIKQSNIYSPSVFNATADDTCTLVCGTANGASSLWYEVARSVN